MAKYSTGSSSGSGGGACELCGTASDSLTTASIAGAELEVCDSCSSHSDNTHTEEKRDQNTTDQERKRRAAKNTARMSDSSGGDSSHWERDGTNYDDDQLPYLVSDYGVRVQEARQEEGYQREELAAELDISENDLLAVEQGRATQVGVGGSVIEAIEEHLDVELAE